MKGPVDRGTTSPPSRRRWLTLAVLCTTVLVLGIDGTILNVALPTLVRDLHASTAELQWIVDAYALVFAGALLTGGSLGDRFGRRGAMSVGLAIFGAASAAAAFSSTATMLTVWRGVMGIGAALIMPATLSILTNVFTEPRERARAIGFWAGTAGIALTLGPITGGFLLQHFWWGSVFLVNVPVVLVAIVLGRIFVPTSRDPSGPPLDPVGALSSVVGIAVVLWAIIEGPDRGWTDPTIILAFVAGVAILGGFAVWELRCAHPMLDMTFFRNPRFTVASLAITMGFFGMAGSMFLISQVLQFVLGFDPLEAGVRMAPFAAVFLVVAPNSARVTERFGTKRVVAAGLSTAATGLLVLASVGSSPSYGRVLIGMLFMGSGIALGMVPATESIMGSLPKAKAGVGSAVNDTTRQVGGLLGVAVLGSLLASGYRSALDTHTRGLNLSPETAHQARASLGGALAAARSIGGHGGEVLAAASRAAFLDGMQLSFVVGAVIIFGGAVLAWAYLPAHAHVHVHRDVESPPEPDDELVVADDVLARVPE